MKILRYLVALGMLVGNTAYAVDWNAAFEATPAASESIGNGPTRIIESKVENRKRAAVEHDWDSIGTDQGASNSGRHLAGSARAFTHATDCSTITALLENDQLGVNTLDEGRLCIDKDDDTLYAWDTSAGPAAWVQVSVPPPPAVPETVAISSDTANGTTNLSLSISTYAEYTTSGSGGDLEVAVTCPSSAGNYSVFVEATVNIEPSTALQFLHTIYNIRFQEKVDAGAFAAVPTSEVRELSHTYEFNTGQYEDRVGQLSTSYLRTTAAASSAYTYHVEVKSAQARILQMKADNYNRITATCMKVP